MRSTEINKKHGPASFGLMFTRPLATLASLQEQPRWFYPTLFAALISAAVNLYVVKRIGLNSLVGAIVQVETTLDREALAQNALAHAGQILFFQSIATFLGSFLVALLTAKVLWLLLTLLGQDLPFKKALAVVAHANMLAVVLREGMIALSVSIIRNPQAFDLKNPLATNAAFFLHPTSPVFSRFLAAFDLITTLNLGLLIIGLTKIAPKLSLRMASITVILPWTAYVGATLLIPMLAK
jgi:hypothetical protein